MDLNISTKFLNLMPNSYVGNVILVSYKNFMATFTGRNNFGQQYFKVFSCKISVLEMTTFNSIDLF